MLFQIPMTFSSLNTHTNIITPNVLQFIKNEHSHPRFSDSPSFYLQHDCIFFDIVLLFCAPLKKLHRFNHILFTLDRPVPLKRSESRFSWIVEKNRLTRTVDSRIEQHHWRRNRAEPELKSAPCLTSPHSSNLPRLRAAAAIIYSNGQLHSRSRRRAWGS